jgi:hypothetical protein
MCRLLQCLLGIKIPIVHLPARKTRGIETPAAVSWFRCPGQAVLGQARCRFGDLEQIGRMYVAKPEPITDLRTPTAGTGGFARVFKDGLPSS